MKSKRIVSFISWNTKEFLDRVLKDFVQEQLIYMYIYIFHYHEEDENYDHFHVIIFPCCGLDYNDIIARFIEPQPHGIPPLGISHKPFYESKDGELHWILYVLHDPDYLKSRYKEVKKYQYKQEELVSNDIRTLKQLVLDAYHKTDFSKDKVINNMINEGISPSELIKNGYVSIKDSCSYHHYFQMSKEDYS